jgi:predicted transcriptional regulator
MKALAQIEQLTKKHIADIARLKDKAIKELESIIASLKKQLAHHETKHAELTKEAKTKAPKTAKAAPAAKPRKVAKRKRLSPAQRAKLPKELSAIIAKNPKGISVGKIVAALSVYPRSSIKKALKDLIKAKAIKMEGTKATAVYKPVK